MRTILALLMMAPPAMADGEPAGEYDYFVLSLSWLPNWCALEGDARRSPQCLGGLGLGWVLHGLWPQYETGWPSYCRTTASDPNRAQTGEMADIMGTSGAAWYQWKKHGRCSGLEASRYFDIARRAYLAVNRPVALRKLTKPVRLPAAVVEDAFLAANPGWSATNITVTCKMGQIQEVRVCLSKELAPRVCGADVIRDCTISDAFLAPIR